MSTALQMLSGSMMAQSIGRNVPMKIVIRVRDIYQMRQSIQVEQHLTLRKQYAALVEKSTENFQQIQLFQPER